MHQCSVLKTSFSVPACQLFGAGGASLFPRPSFARGFMSSWCQTAQVWLNKPEAWSLGENQNCPGGMEGRHYFCRSCGFHQKTADHQQATLPRCGHLCQPELCSELGGQSSVELRHRWLGRKNPLKAADGGNQSPWWAHGVSFSCHNPQSKHLEVDVCG